LTLNVGMPIWNFTTGGYVTSGPAVSNGVVYFGSYDHKVYALDALMGALKWSFTTGNVVASSPVVADGNVYIGSFDNKTYAFSKHLKFSSTKHCLLRNSWSSYCYNSCRGRSCDT
jgi:outer membrane protein assembly factor BamB